MHVNQLKYLLTCKVCDRSRLSNNIGSLISISWASWQKLCNRKAKTFFLIFHGGLWATVEVICWPLDSTREPRGSVLDRKFDCVFTCVSSPLQVST